MKYGVDEKDARYFEERIQSGGYWVGVDLDDNGAARAEVEAILQEHRGRWSRTGAPIASGSATSR